MFIHSVVYMCQSVCILCMHMFKCIWFKCVCVYMCMYVGILAIVRMEKIINTYGVSSFQLK